MNETDRLSIVFSAVMASYRRMVRVWQAVAFMLLLLCMVLASCIAWSVFDTEAHVRPCVGMSVTTAVTGKLLA